MPPTHIVTYIVIATKKAANLSISNHGGIFFDKNPITDYHLNENVSFIPLNSR